MYSKIYIALVLILLSLFSFSQERKTYTVEGSKKVLICNDSAKLCMMLWQEGETISFNTNNKQAGNFGFHSIIKKDSSTLVTLMNVNGYVCSNYYFQDYGIEWLEVFTRYAKRKCDEVGINWTAKKQLKFLTKYEQEITNCMDLAEDIIYVKTRDTAANRCGKELINNYINEKFQ